VVYPSFLAPQGGYSLLPMVLRVVIPSLPMVLRVVYVPPVYLRVVYVPPVYLRVGNLCPCTSGWVTSARVPQCVTPRCSPQCVLLLVVHLRVGTSGWVLLSPLVLQGVVLLSPLLNSVGYPSPLLNSVGYPSPLVPQGVGSSPVGTSGCG